MRLLAGASYRLKKLLGTLANLTMPAVDFGHSDSYRAVKKKKARWGEGVPLALSLVGLFLLTGR